MTTLNNNIKISGLDNLSEETLQELTSILSPDQELFSEEENNNRVKISQALAKKTDIHTEMVNLEVVQHAGVKPNINKVNEFIKGLFGGWISLVVIMFIIHCVMWVVRLVSSSSWDTWKWTSNLFFYGFSICVIIYIGVKIWYHLTLVGWETQMELYREYKDKLAKLQKAMDYEDSRINNYRSEINKIIDNRGKILAYAFRLKGLPLKDLKNWDYKNAKESYFSLLKLKQNAYSSKNPDKIKEFLNTKYEIFYAHSLASESPSKEVLDTFYSYIPLFSNKEINRDVTDPSPISQSAIKLLSTKLYEYDADAMNRYIHECDQILEMDTSGIFTKYDSSLLEEQTRKMQGVYNKCAKYVDSFQNLIICLNNSLSICRLVAFRNIYLGAELLHMIKEGAGGGRSAISTDTIHNIEIEALHNNLNLSSFSFSESINNIVNDSIESVSCLIQNVISNKHTRKYAANNPKNAALAVAGAAAFGAITAGIEAWKKRNAKINDLSNKQDKIFESLFILIEKYCDSYPVAVRTIELIQAITKVNSGFIEIYKPLYDKIFVHQNMSSVSMTELHSLSRALSHYNNISKTNL